MCAVVFALESCHVVFLFSYGKLPYVQLCLSWHAVMCTVVFCHSKLSCCVDDLVTASCHVVLLFSYG